MIKINSTQVQKVLDGMEYPATKDDVLKQAMENGADKDTITFLESLPEQTYNSLADVSDAIDEMKIEEDETEKEPVE